MKKVITWVAVIVAIIVASNVYDMYKANEAAKIKAAQKAEADRKEAERKATPRWEYVGTSKDGTVWSVHLPARIDKDNANVRTVWTMTKRKDGSYTKYFESYQCDLKWNATGNYYAYNSKGDLIYSSSLSNTWINVIPTTIGDELLTKVCE